MGSLSHTQAAIMPPDLKVTTLGTETLHPCEPTERRSMFLSNIDQVLNFSVETVYFFKANAEYPVEVVVEQVRSAVERLLVPYDYLAGRLRFNEGERRMEIDCNAAGAKFVTASSELRLDELGELQYPNPAFRQLVLAADAAGGGRLEDRPLLAFQVTTFNCGGFSLGISTDHTAFDGFSFQLFLKNLATMAANKPLPVAPYNERQLLAARSPPRVEYPHPELLKLELPRQEEQILDGASTDLESKLFPLDTDNIFALKKKAKMDGGDNLDPRVITSFNVVVAHLWRCKALATNGANDKNKMSTVLYAVDIRRRLSPPLPLSYTGNAVLSAYANATCYDLENSLFSQIASKVRDGATRMSDDYIRSVIDWGQMYEGFPSGDLFVSSWWKLGFAEVEYPWGKPIYSSPVANPRRDFVLLLPDIKGADKGVNVLISLPREDMEKFESLFYKFLNEAMV